MGTHADSRFIAWETAENTAMEIEPAPIDRDWMEQSNRRFAYRCLPLAIANQSGWIMRSPFAFEAIWNGGESAADLRIAYPSELKETRVNSHFGHGILTFEIPFLFRTPSGVNLWVKGPSNWIKDGIQPLEGVVETDWANATFTMNWKFHKAQSHRCL